MTKHIAFWSPIGKALFVADVAKLHRELATRVPVVVRSKYTTRPKAHPMHN